jgi:transcriptional regulator with XRE-family HTH domain
MCAVARETFDPSDWQRVGRQVRTRRQQLRLSQRKAAQKAGVAQGTWVKLENGGSTGGLQRSAIAETLEWRSDSLDLMLRGGDPVPENDRLTQGPPVEFLPETEPDRTDAFMRRLDELVDEVSAEEGRKALESALAGGNPELVELASVVWPLRPEDFEVLKAVALRLRDQNRHTP